MIKWEDRLGVGVITGGSWNYIFGVALVVGDLEPEAASSVRIEEARAFSWIEASYFNKKGVPCSASCWTTKPIWRVTPRINYAAEVGFRFDNHFQIVSTAVQFNFLESRGRNADVHPFRYIPSPQFFKRKILADDTTSELYFLFLPSDEANAKQRVHKQNNCL